MAWSRLAVFWVTLLWGNVPKLRVCRGMFACCKLAATNLLFPSRAQTTDLVLAGQAEGVKDAGVLLGEEGLVV